MESNIVVVLSVAIGTLLTALINLQRERSRAKTERMRHLWEQQDRAQQASILMSKMDDNRQQAANAVKQVGETMQKKLVSIDERLAHVMPESAETLNKMLADSGVVPQSDIAKILIELKKGSMAAEEYAHKNVHRINNVLMKLVKVDDATLDEELAGIPRAKIVAPDPPPQPDPFRPAPPPPALPESKTGA